MVSSLDALMKLSLELAKLPCPACGERLLFFSDVCPACRHRPTSAERAAARLQFEATCAALRRRNEAEKMGEFRLGCGGVLVVVGILLLAFFFLALVSPPSPGGTGDPQSERFAGLMAISWFCLPLLLPGILLFLSGWRARRVRKAILDGDEERAHRLHLDSRRKSRLEGGAALVGFGVLLLVIRLGFSPPPEGERDAASRSRKTPIGNSERCRPGIGASWRRPSCPGCSSSRPHPPGRSSACGPILWQSLNCG